MKNTIEFTTRSIKTALNALKIPFANVFPVENSIFIAGIDPEHGQIIASLANASESGMVGKYFGMDQPKS